MRGVFLTIMAFTLFFCFSCGNNPGSTGASKSLPYYENNTYQQKRISELPSWIKEGVEGYGIIIAHVEERTKGIPVKCRVIRIDGTEIKLRFLESKTLFDDIKCTQRVEKGVTYWEKWGEFWQTEEEALAYIREKGWTSF